MSIQQLWILFIVVSLLVPVAISAQHRQTPNAVPSYRAPGSVSGRVFAITEGGDIKPARFAHVYLVYLWSGIPAPKAEAEKPIETAGATFLGRYNDALQRHLDEMKDPDFARDEVLVCQSELLAVNRAVLATLDWVRKNGKSKQFIGVDTDEEGSFQVASVPPGRYTLMARGRAGINDAFWNSELSVQAGSHVSVKLSSPEKACINLP